MNTQPTFIKILHQAKQLTTAEQLILTQLLLEHLLQQAASVETTINPKMIQKLWHSSTLQPQPIRNHAAFFNSYAQEDEGLYDDYPTR